MRGKREAAPNRKIGKSRWVSGVGLISAAVVIAVAAVFAWLVWQTQLLPVKLMSYLCAALGAVVLIVALFLLNHRNTVRYILGVILSLCLTVALVVGGMAVQRGVAALNRITTAEQQIEYIGVYVLKDDPIPHLEDAGDYMFGLWSGMDADMLARLRQAVKFDIPLHDAVRACTLNPAQAIGIDDRCGTLDEGKEASFILLDEKDLSVRAMVFKGQRIA